MEYVDGYNILNIDNDFKDLSVPQATYDVELNGIGSKRFFIFEYDYINVIVDGHLFTMGLNDQNPVIKGDTILWIDDDSNLWYGTI